MPITEIEIEEVRQKATNILLQDHPNSEAIKKIVGLLGKFGVDGGFFGYVNIDSPRNLNNLLNPNDFCNNPNYQPSKKRPIFIQEARGCCINSPYNADEYLNEILPYDYYSFSSAFRVYKKTGIYVASRNKFLLESKIYKEFYSKKGNKDFFVFVFPIGSEHLTHAIWLCLGCYKRFFSDDEITALETLFNRCGFGDCLRLAMARGSEIDCLTKYFTNVEWDFATYLAKENPLGDKTGIANKFSKKKRTIENWATQISEKRGIECNGKTGLIDVVHSVVYQNPLYHISH